jgi:acetolactate synthase-1/2/3 large subunit
VCRGLGIATAGKPGPVSLSIPVNVFDGDSEGSVYRPVPRDWRSDSGEGASPASVAAAAALLNAASRPMMIVGGGAWWELGRAALQDLSRQFGIPVFTTELARGLIPDDGEICFGYAHPSFSRTFRELKNADLIVMVGTEMNLHTGAANRGWVSRDTKIIQLHRDPAQIGIGRPTDVALLGSLEDSLRALAQSVDDDTRKRQGEWMQHIRGQYAHHRKEWNELAQKHGDGQKGAIHPMRVCTSLARRYSEDVRVIIDGGDFVHWPRLFLEAKTPGYWMDGAEIGVLGASLPVGIGAQLGRPAGQTWVFIGDGGFGFYGFDLSTAVENNIALKVIIGNDACWGVERRLQRKDYGRTVAVDLPYIEYHTVARGLGAQALLVDDPAKLDGAVDTMVAAKGPFVLNIKIPRDAGRPLMG